MENGEQRAFPADAKTQSDGGLSKREYFASMAMQGLLSFYGLNKNRTNEPNLPYNEEYMREVSRYSVRQADALLAELSKSN